jgi:tetratricopeptide (TPR) repeat protein
MSTDTTAENILDQSTNVRDLLGISKEEFDAMGGIGAMFYEQGCLEKAQIIFEGLVELDPESHEAHSALGALYTRIEKDQEALIHLDRAISLNKKQIEPYVNRAEVRLRQAGAQQEEIELAIEDLNRAIELDPNGDDAAANRARAMVMAIYETLKFQGVINDSNRLN